MLMVNSIGCWNIQFFTFVFILFKHLKLGLCESRLHLGCYRIFCLDSSKRSRSKARTCRDTSLSCSSPSRPSLMLWIPTSSRWTFRGIFKFLKWYNAVVYQKQSLIETQLHANLLWHENISVNSVTSRYLWLLRLFNHTWQIFTKYICPSSYAWTSLTSKTYFSGTSSNLHRILRTWRHRRRDEQAQMSREINIAPQQRRRRQRTQPHPLVTFTTHQRHLAELLTWSTTSGVTPTTIRINLITNQSPCHRSSAISEAGAELTPRIVQGWVRVPFPFLCFNICFCDRKK